MKEPPLKSYISDGRMIVTFTRPGSRNPLSGDVLDELGSVLASAGQERGVDEIIFTGTGEAFASGADINEIMTLTTETAPAFAHRGQTLMDQIAGSTAVTTAFINGHCYGGALDLALACRRRFAVRDAAFCHPGARLGIMTGWGGTQRLPRLIGEGRALEIFLTAEPIDAAEALRIGLIDGIYSDLDSIPKPLENVTL
ncbi:MAG: enoyl-CoA hydratase/isomerase family protein [Chloracidobacterium sp.]|nr:enoyl-CoA hydratase/isomerase family protein [Chloracidobacterium sp.]